MKKEAYYLWYITCGIFRYLLDLEKKTLKNLAELNKTTKFKHILKNVKDFKQQS